MHITITGNLGSGKSTICKLLNEKYQFEIYSTGTIQRELAKEMNMTTLELNQLMCSDHKYDKMIDDATTRISAENKDKDIIFDSRLAWHFVEDSFKVFLSVSLDTSAKRVMNDQKRGEVESYSSIEEAKELLALRAETEKKRYKDIYNLDYFNLSNYNLVIDNTYSSPETITKFIINQARAHDKNQPTMSKRLISPKRLIEEKDIEPGDCDRLAALIDEYKNENDIIKKKIKIKEENDKFIILEGLDEVKAAYLAQVDFVQIVE